LSFVEARQIAAGATAATPAHRKTGVWRRRTLDAD
jgi:hypothetical protein